MTTDERNNALLKFIGYLDNQQQINIHKIADDMTDIDLNSEQLPNLEAIPQLIHYHHDITNTIQGTYKTVSDIMSYMKQLKNRKKNVQMTIDCMTSIQQIKKISYGLGSQPRQVYNNIENYYSIKNKVYHMQKFINRIESQILQIQKQYQSIFDSQIAKHNSNNLSEITKVLQLIQKHSLNSNKPNANVQIKDFYISSVKKQFKHIEENLFNIPILGVGDSNYLFFDMAKSAMKIVANVANTSKSNVLKISKQEGYIQILKNLYQLVAGGIILQILMRLKKYYEIDKIIIKQSKISIKERDSKRVEPYVRQFVAIWNQLQRLKLHLLSQITQNNQKKVELRLELQSILSNANFVEINYNLIRFIQATMRYKLDKLLKQSTFATSLCNLDEDFFKDITQKNIINNPHAQDFLQQILNIVSRGIEKALQTLNTLVVSAIINYANNNLIYQDVFFAFNQLFYINFNKMPSNDKNVQKAIILILNAMQGFPKALKSLNSIKLPLQVPEERIKAEIHQISNTNISKCQIFIDNLLSKLTSAQWFRYEITKQYQKIPVKWSGLQNQCSSKFIQKTCAVHSQQILQTQFSKKFTQQAAINFEKEVRSIISFYQKYSHSILPHFKNILDFIQVLLLQNNDDFKKIIKNYEGIYKEDQLKRIWNLKA